MKTLTVFYSLTGHTGKLARAINEAAGGDQLEIKTKKTFPKEEGKMYFALVVQMIFGGIGVLPPDKDPNDYDLVFLGAPVWAGNVTPVAKTFLKKAKLRNKKIALFCVHGSDSSGKAFETLKKELEGNEIVGKIDFKMEGITPAQEAANIESAQKWARNMVNRGNQ